MKIDVPFHSSIIINDEIYFDPYNIQEGKKAKVIFITHSHYDHFSPEDIVKIMDSDTVFVAPHDVVKSLKNAFINEIVEVEAGNEYEVKGIKFTTFASYNEIKPFHPRRNGWVGYNVIIERQNVVVPGDTDITYELKTQKADVLFIPIGGTYTMTARDAVKITNMLKPKIVVPIHYGSIVGSKKDEKEFLKYLDKGIKAEIYIK